MKFAGRSSNEYEGEIDLLECECGHEQSQPKGAKRIKDVRCRKCGKKSEN